MPLGLCRSAACSSHLLPQWSLTSSAQFGKPFGFIQKGADIAGILETIHSYAFYGMVAGIYHEWHPTTYKIWQWLAPKERGGGIAHIMQFAGQTINDWNQRSEVEKTKNEEKTQGGDLLYTDQTGSLLAKVRRNPESFKAEDIFYHMSMNVLAGGETTAASTANIIYYLIKNPTVLTKLRKELQDALGKRDEASKRISIKDAQNIPYLQAVIKESLRILPNGLHFPRIVPKGGLTLAGQFFPEGVSHFISYDAWGQMLNTRLLHRQVLALIPGLLTPIDPSMERTSMFFGQRDG